MIRLLQVHLLLFSLLVPLTADSANSGCQCLCSIFYTRGGEKKLCREEAVTKTQCNDWYYELPTATNKKDCQSQGEDLHECKGYFKEKILKDSWTQSEGGRLHSCKFF